MDAVVHDVINLKNRGAIISIPCGSDSVIKAGDKFKCGNNSWLVRSVERYDGYMRWMLLAPLGDSKAPVGGCIITRIIEEHALPVL
jgi:hypothetical protein